MDQILLYTTLGYNKQYLELFKLFCESLCFHTANLKNILVITDEQFHKEAESIVAKYAFLNYHFLCVPNSSSPEEASKQKTRVFEFKDIYKYKICLYVDVDCLFLKDLYSIFKAPVNDGKLYVYPESNQVNDHLYKWFSLRKKNGECFYSSKNIEHFTKHKIYPFNAGLFLFRIGPLLEKSFRQLNEFMTSFDGEGFYEQSFMNTYFNLNGMSDFSYFTETVAMQSTHNVDKKYVETFSYQTGIRKEITTAHCILHFNATMPGNWIRKYMGMKRYFDFCKTKQRNEVIFDNRIEMIEKILPEGAHIAEIGVFKGEFAEQLLKTNPAHLYLVDCWEKGPMMSGNADGNDVETIPNAEDLFFNVQEKFQFNPNVSIHREFSSSFLEKIQDMSLDAIYIDADHSYEGVKRDLELAIKKVKKYGLIMGHDYEMNMTKARTRYDFGVKKAVDEFCLTYGLKIFAKGTDGCVSFSILNTYNTYQEAKLFQIVAISKNEMRKKILVKQCSELFKGIDLQFVDTTNPDDYFPIEASELEKRVLDCAKNHVKALNVSILPTSTEFSLIVEDDVLFHTTNSITLIEDLILNWQEYMGTDKLASLGWVPFRNYYDYTTLKPVRKFNFNPQYCTLNSFWAYGLQAYMVRKHDLQNIPTMLSQPTYEKFKEIVFGMKCPHINASTDLAPADIVIPRLLGQKVVFPPIGIEMNSLSQLGHDNIKFWNIYFKNHEMLKSCYYSYQKDTIIDEYFSRYPEIQVFQQKFKQVVIWGFPLYSHTHSYIHNGWFRAFQALGIPVFWFWDKDFPKDFNFSNTCFITEGWVEKNIPVRADCTYIVHIAHNPRKYTDIGARLIDIRYNVNSINDYNYKYELPLDAIKISNDTLYEVVENDKAVAEKRGREIQPCHYEALYMYWATDLLPHEFNYEDASRPRQKTFYHIGQLEKTHPLYEFAKLLEKEDVSFHHINPWDKPVTFEANIKMMKDSYCCPDFRNLRGVDCDRDGYIPDRVFKAISYGQTGITNSKRLKIILGNYVEYVETIDDILPIVKKREFDVEWRKSAMLYIAENHTYLNRIRDLARCISL